MKPTGKTRAALVPGPEPDAYGRVAMRYYRDGWPCVLPVWRGTARDKQPMVKGYHGRDGAWPDETTMRLWSNRYSRANVALRLPKWVVGIDVDHYSGKAGGSVLAGLEDELGLLPAGPISTSREDGVSGIRLLTVPGSYTAVDWPSQAGDDIEMITWYERYVIVGPSVHATGLEYKWWQGDSSYRVSRGGAPSPMALPVLPEVWCEYLTGLASGSSEKWRDTGYSGTAVEWLDEYGRGEPCRYLEEMGPKWMKMMADGGSAHEAAKRVTAHAVKAAAEGHTGINLVLADVRAEFITRVGARSVAERRRGEGKAIGEWRSLLGGAIAQYGGNVADEDEVCDELEGIK